MRVLNRKRQTLFLHLIYVLHSRLFRATFWAFFRKYLLPLASFPNKCYVPAPLENGEIQNARETFLPRSRPDSGLPRPCLCATALHASGRESRRAAPRANLSASSRVRQRFLATTGNHRPAPRLRLPAAGARQTHLSGGRNRHAAHEPPHARPAEWAAHLANSRSISPGRKAARNQSYHRGYHSQ